MGRHQLFLTYFTNSLPVLCFTLRQNWASIAIWSLFDHLLTFCSVNKSWLTATMAVVTIFILFATYALSY